MPYRKDFRKRNLIGQSSSRNITTIHYPAITNHSNRHHTRSGSKIIPLNFLIGFNKCSQRLDTVIGDNRIRSQRKPNYHKNKTPVHKQNKSKNIILLLNILAPVTTPKIDRHIPFPISLTIEEEDAIMQR